MKMTRKQYLRQGVSFMALSRAMPQLTEKRGRQIINACEMAWLRRLGLHQSKRG